MLGEVRYVVAYASVLEAAEREALAEIGRLMVRYVETRDVREEWRLYDEMDRLAQEYRRRFPRKED